MRRIKTIAATRSLAKAMSGPPRPVGSSGGRAGKCEIGTNRPKVEGCLDNALQLGALAALGDLPHTGRPGRITAEARAWVVSLACVKPKALGYAEELWTTRLLASHVRDHCERAGHPSLSQLARGTVSKILAGCQLRPDPRRAAFPIQTHLAHPGSLPRPPSRRQAPKRNAEPGNSVSDPMADSWGKPQSLRLARLPRSPCPGALRIYAPTPPAASVAGDERCRLTDALEPRWRNTASGLAAIRWLGSTCNSGKALC